MQTSLLFSLPHPSFLHRCRRDVSSENHILWTGCKEALVSAKQLKPEKVNATGPEYLSPNPEGRRTQQSPLLKINKRIKRQCRLPGALYRQLTPLNTWQDSGVWKVRGKQTRVVILSCHASRYTSSSVFLPLSFVWEQVG